MNPYLMIHSDNDIIVKLIFCSGVPDRHHDITDVELWWRYWICSRCSEPLQLNSGHIRFSFKQCEVVQKLGMELIKRSGIMRLIAFSNDDSAVVRWAHFWQERLNCQARISFQHCLHRLLSTAYRKHAITETVKYEVIIIDKHCIVALLSSS